MRFPDILRVFNPNLRGPSVGVGPQTNFEVSQFNAAVPGAIVGNMPAQARDLVQRMRDHPE